MTDELQALRLFNTLTRSLEEFIPRDAATDTDEDRPLKVKMYVCGPTVYDAAHLGHARCYITWDVLYRFLQFLGYDVTYVRNVTDVDDKILNRARDLNQLPAEVAQRNYESFTADMQALKVLPPDAEPKATEYVATMIEVIRDLVAKGAAYVAPDGTVYFRVASDVNYGQLSKKPLEDLKSGARVEVDPHKENPLDFALWKAVPAEEATDAQLARGVCFESPWGRGRPGWHIECSAMNYALLGPQIDIHAGGADLIFPHHENEIAQTETWCDLAGGEDHPEHRFAKYWLHNGFVNVSGEKMSKSLGNFSTIKGVLERYDANTIRYFLLTNHYRMPVDFNDEALQAAENWCQKLYRQLQESMAQETAAGVDLEDLEIELSECRAFLEAMLEDLNTPKALAVLNQELANLRAAKNTETHLAVLTRVLIILDVLGFNLDFAARKSGLPLADIRGLHQELAQNVQTIAGEGAAEDLLKDIVVARRQAKSEKNWPQADAIRNRLGEIGLQILDNKDGTTTIEKDGLEIVRV